MLLIALLTVPSLILRFAITRGPIGRLPAAGVASVLLIVGIYLGGNPTPVGAAAFFSFLVLIRTRSNFWKRGL